MHNRDNISRLCKLLNLNDATIATEVGSVSDAELLVDFLLLVCLIFSVLLHLITSLSVSHRHSVRKPWPIGAE